MAAQRQAAAGNGQQLTKAKPVEDDHIQKISTAISTCRGSMALADTGDFMGAIFVARGMRQLQELITPEVMEEIQMNALRWLWDAIALTWFVWAGWMASTTRRDSKC